MDVFALKTNLIHEIFVRTADENYITARWCGINNLKTDFLWLAVHALEKYLKAALLSNGKTSKKYGHDVVRLYDALKIIAGPLLPSNLEKPPHLETGHWFDRTPEQFIAHLLRNGNADNRYLIYGYNTFSEDLYMLDKMVFAIRRLVCPLDEPMIRRPNAPKFIFRDILKNQPSYYTRLAMPLDEMVYAREDLPGRTAALNMNLAFAPKDYQHQPIWLGSSSRTPVILRRILEPLGSDDPQTAAEGVTLARWFLTNVQVPRGKPGDSGVAEQIATAIEVACARHGIIT